ncbi:6-phosphogluconate dehydrogenase C-terminal domain-like protein [Hortaea werneckii]|nr:6-phosphogluconate dehydrogenase C-terminal domain-like protein [Hortaea werneckii]KAI7325155.1 6-phosphogluconate dehydrogenase C-terminal domain-like protein [Hortaea werneckii]
MQWPDTGAGKNSAISSPVSPLPIKDITPGQSPVIQTLRDNKQWVDLDYLSPKLIRELCRQYGPPPEQDSASTISKGAAKVRAWARHSKLGIDIRLRRKLNLEHDEVTDIRLIPEPRPVPREKPTPVAELPGQPHEIQELPDSSRARELACPPARGFSGSSQDDNVDPLPRYEPVSPSGNEISFGCHVTAPDVEHHSASRTITSPTPDRALSPPETRFNGAVNGETLDEIQKRSHTNTDSGNVSSSSAGFRALNIKLEQANERLDQERSAKERFEKLLADVRRELTSESDSSRNERDVSSTNPFLDGLRVSNTASYETQTGVTPPSPGETINTDALNQDTVLLDRRRSKGAPKSRARKPSISYTRSKRTRTRNSDLVRRQPTVQKRLPIDASKDEILTSLLHSQVKLLGPDHQLANQAKSELARYRSEPSGTNEKTLLTTVHRSRALAAEILGSGHSRVEAFSRDLLAAENSYEQVADNDRHEDPLQDPSQTGEITHDQSSFLQAGAQFRRDRAQQKTSLPVLKTTFHPVTKDPSPILASAIDTPTADPWITYASPHKSDMSTMKNIASALWAVLTKIIETLQWIQRRYGPPQPVAQDRSRVKWTCSCGEELFDDFVELRPGAARELEAYLNRPRTYTGGSPTSPSSSQGSRSFTGSSVGGAPSANTSWSSYGFQNTSPGGEDKLRVPGTSTGSSFGLPFFNQPEPPWLLTCANEERSVPKLAHLDMAPHNIRSDKDLAMALRNHYFEINNKWWRALKLRGLATIDFVQFEVHQNRFADIRKSPDMPLPGQDYAFEPGDLMPPVGSKYLLHLFRHPQDYDGEMITYLRIPKKTGRLGLVPTPLATVGILSIGDMGVGIARLLIANNYCVVTNASDRSQATQDRARRNGVELLSADVELCNIADYIISIVPPRDAFATAKRIVTATDSAKYQSRTNPLCYLDLNAISPQSSRDIDEVLKTSQSPVRFIDGGIIGAPPRQIEDGSWYRPSIPLSGPENLTSVSPSGSNLATILNTSYVGMKIGSATGLKMCFAALSKGFTALAIESLTTAHNLGCLPELKRHLEDFNPGAAKAINSLTTMPPKAYRWEREMEEIAKSFEADGGFAEDESMFRPIAKVYKLVAEGTELGSEKVESRLRGKSVEDVALLMAEGTAKRKEKVE